MKNKERHLIFYEMHVFIKYKTKIQGGLAAALENTPFAPPPHLTVKTPLSGSTTVSLLVGDRLEYVLRPAIKSIRVKAMGI